MQLATELKSPFIRTHLFEIGFSILFTCYSFFVGVILPRPVDFVYLVPLGWLIIPIIIPTAWLGYNVLLSVATGFAFGWIARRSWQFGITGRILLGLLILINSFTFLHIMIAMSQD
jgi:hypothetical protein